MSLSQHTLTPSQLVTGNDQRISHRINSARATILSVNRQKMSGAILDLGFCQGFNHLIMHWVFKVLRRKGVDVKVILRLRRIYENNYTRVSVNNILGSPIPNIRVSLCQGDIPSMFWFCVAIDPLLYSLNR